MSDAEQKRSHGVRAQNLEYARYEAVEKDQHYHLAEQRGAEEFDDEFRIRTCDMAQWFDGGEPGKDAFATELGAALEEIGFAILIGHGVDPTLHRESFERVERFFRETTVEQRRPYRAERHGSVNQGWFPMKETSDIHPDLVEGWVFCRRAFDFDGDRTPEQLREFWPLPEYEPFFRQYFHAHERRLFKPIMRAILRYFGCDEHSYDQRLTDTNFGLRLNWYPPVEADDLAAGGGRLLGHEDVDLFTILPAASAPGLQVLNRRNHKWVRLDAPPGSIVINTGDYMQRITNDRLPSTTHRVGVPADRAQRRQPRMSVPIAVYLWEHELLEVLPTLTPPRYRPISAIDFHTGIQSKLYGDDYRTTGSD